MVEIDNIDKKILFEIDKNSRRSIKEIAKKLGLKRDTAAYRLKQLEKNNVITGYYTIIDYSKLGYMLVRLYLKFQNTTPSLEEEIIQHLIAEKSCLTMFKAEGTWDLASGILVTSFLEFKDIQKRLHKKYRKNINIYEVSIFYEFIHYLKNYLVEEKLRDYKKFSTGKSTGVKFDQTDIKLLRMIAHNSRISLLELASGLKLSSMAARYRLKQLEKESVILGYRALINLSTIRYEYYKVDIELEDISCLKELEEYAKQHPHITYEDKTIGGLDFEFDVEIKNDDEFYKLIATLKERFSGMIRTYRYYKAKKIYKYIYLPDE